MKKKVLIRYIIYFLLGLIVVALGLKSQGIENASTTLELMKILSDCFLFPGVLFGGIGALTWIGAKGTFDMLGYGFSFLISGFTHPKQKFESYYEYKLRKEEAEDKWLPEMFFVGLFYFALSILFLVIYMSIAG